MNGNWFPWAEHANGNQPGDYVAAWRHVHDIFTQVGATNATWVWCPYVELAPELGPLARYYPGDDYVDWTSLDGFNWGKNRVNPQPWTSFDKIFGPSYRAIVNKHRPRQADAAGGDGLRRRRPRQGGLDRRDVQAAAHQVPADPRPDLVRAGRPRRPVAAGDGAVGDRRPSAAASASAASRTTTSRPSTAPRSSRRADPTPPAAPVALETKSQQRPLSGVSSPRANRDQPDEDRRAQDPTPTAARGASRC